MIISKCKQCSGLLISSSWCQYIPAADLRVVFQYNGLLEADPADGGYKKVLPGRLVDPGKLVTWTPAVYSTPARGNSESLLKLLPKKGNLTSNLTFDLQGESKKTGISKNFKVL